jgi:hypothetical protein
MQLLCHSLRGDHQEKCLAAAFLPSIDGTLPRAIVLCKTRDTMGYPQKISLHGLDLFDVDLLTI